MLLWTLNEPTWVQNPLLKIVLYFRPGSFLFSLFKQSRRDCSLTISKRNGTNKVVKGRPYNLFSTSIYRPNILKFMPLRNCLIFII